MINQGLLTNGEYQSGDQPGVTDTWRVSECDQPGFTDKWRVSECDQTGVTDKWREYQSVIEQGY